MEKLSFDERKKLLYEIIEKHAPEFKYDLTRQHLSEDQIEALWPIFMAFWEKVLHELSAKLRSIRYSHPPENKD